MLLVLLYCFHYLSLGNPKPTFKWSQNGKPVKEGQYIFTRIHDYAEREYHGCLQLDSPTHINNGRYKLEVANPYGTDEKEVDAHFMHMPSDGKIQHYWMFYFLFLHHYHHDVWSGY